MEPEAVAAFTSDMDERKRILNRLKRLGGQVRGLQTMVESGKDCDAILAQVMAAKSALEPPVPTRQPRRTSRSE